jgi:hypothetical protein
MLVRAHRLLEALPALGKLSPARKEFAVVLP